MFLKQFFSNKVVHIFAGMSFVVAIKTTRYFDVTPDAIVSPISALKIPNKNKQPTKRASDEQQAIRWTNKIKSFEIKTYKNI